MTYTKSLTTLSLDKILAVPFPYNDAHMLSNIAADTKYDVKVITYTSPYEQLIDEDSFINAFYSAAQAPNSHAIQIARKFYHAYCTFHNHRQRKES